MKNKWDRSAMRFASVAYLARQAMVAVTFENGDRFVVGIDSLLSNKANGDIIDWKKMRIGETGDVLEAPTRGDVIEIPWDRIRSIADPEYQAHLTDISRQVARELGKRIRSMRLESKLTRSSLAEKVGATAEMIVQLEAGNIEPRTDLLRRVASALGKRMKDFTEAGTERKAARRASRR